MKTPTKRATRRLAASLAIITALATSGVWAATDTNWRGGSGGTEAAPLEFYNADNWASGALPSSSYNMVFPAGTHVVLTNNYADAATMQVSGDIKPYAGDYTFLGAYIFPTLNAPQTGTDTISIVKKGDWKLTYAAYIGMNTDSHVTFTNVYGKIEHTNSGKWFEIANFGTCIVENLSGDWNIAGYFSVAQDKNARGELYWRGGNLTCSNTTEPFCIGRGESSTAIVEKYAGIWTIANSIRMAGAKGKNASATFRHLGGVTTVNGDGIEMGANSNSTTGGADFELSGGTVETKLIQHGAGSAPAVFTFDGGTLKALAAGTIISNSNYLVVNVTSNGGTIDANGMAVEIEEAIADASGETGAMTFKGGGSVSLKYANTYTGATKVELGTKIIATTADAKNSVLANLVVTGVAADGDYYVFEYSGLTDADLANVTCPGGAAGTTITRDGNLIKVHYVAPADLGWNGGDAAWATANAWTNATGTAKTWTDGNYAVFATGDTVTLGADVAAVSVTFNADATIAAGDGTLTVPVVDVGSGVLATIAAPTAGALEKTGTGTLTLGSTREGTATTLTEGTLVANAPIGTLVFGTDYPVTFDYCGQTLSTIPASAVGGGDVTLKNGTFGSSINVNMNSGSLRVEGDSTVVNCNEFNVGPADGSSSASYVQIGGMFKAGWHVRGRCGDFIMTNVTITASKNCEVGSSSAAATRGRMILSGGSASIVGNFNVFNGELEIMNETVEVADSVNMGSNGNSGLITLKSGGTLTTKVIQKYGTPASATVLFDGGTLKANAENANGLVRNEAILSIQTSANGGTIDAAGYAVTVHRKIENKSGESGAMTFKGGGSVTLAVAPTYTGGTTVEAGTVVAVADRVAFAALGSIEVTGLVDDICEVVRLTGSETFSQADLPANTDDVTFSVSLDGKSIFAANGTPGEVWIGGSGDLATAANWYGGVVPTENATIKWATPITLTNSGSFSPSTLTIPESSAVVTLADDLHVTGSLTNANKLAIAPGASLTVDGDIVVCDGKGTFLNSNEGTVTVSGNAVCKSGTTAKQYDVVTANTNPMRVGGFVFHRDDAAKRAYFRLESNNAGPGAWVVGANGFRYQSDLQYSELQWRYFAQANPVTLYSSANWTLRNSGRNGTTKGDLNVFANSSLTIDTSDYDNPALPHTVTLEGRIMAEGPVTVTGCGTLEIATTGSHESLAEDYKHTYITNGVTLAVTDTATLKVNAGKAIKGAGTISFAAGTTLALDASALGTVGDENFSPAIPGLALPETGTATLRIDGDRLRSGNYVLLNAVPANYANLAVDCTTAAIADRKASVVEKNGQLVLNIQPDGLMVIFR